MGRSEIGRKSETSNFFVRFRYGNNICKLKASWDMALMQTSVKQICYSGTQKQSTSPENPWRNSITAVPFIWSLLQKRHNFNFRKRSRRGRREIHKLAQGIGGPLKIRRKEFNCPLTHRNAFQTLLEFLDETVELIHFDLRRRT